MTRLLYLSLWLGLFLVACSDSKAPPPADLVITHARVYTLSWPEPSLDGSPHEFAPRDQGGWGPDASAIAIKGDRIVYVGDEVGVRPYVQGATVLDFDGATVIPGLVDSHTHVVELGGNLSRVDLRGASSEDEIIDRVVLASMNREPGTWIVGHGWDEGAWADRYPTNQKLSERLAQFPVVLMSLHGFAIWGNARALEKAGIDRHTPSPSGGTIIKNEKGEPTGILLNRATPLLMDAIPEVTPSQLDDHILTGLKAMAEAGYTTVHEAGVPRQNLEGFQRLASRNALPLHVHAMLSARDPSLVEEWIERGPQRESLGRLTVRAVKAYYDGALGSRGARLLSDYSDRPGHRGVSGSEYGFDEHGVAALMNRGFQVGIHAIGDAGNREVLDFIRGAVADDEVLRAGRHRIEHAQVVHPDDFPRFAEYGIIASMQPPHAMEDKAWAEERLGSERIEGAYAWRTLRELAVPIVFNADLPGSDFDVFYGLHSAITRRDRNHEPKQGWYPSQRMTPEEAIRAYTSWAAFAAFAEDEAGIIAVGRRADITVMSIDPFVLGETHPAEILEGEILATIVEGQVIYSR